MPVATAEAAWSSDSQELAVRRSASLSIRTSAAKMTAMPSFRISRDLESTSEKQVTSVLPLESEIRTQAMRLPVLVVRSLVPTTVPASLMTPAPPRAAASIRAMGVTRSLARTSL